MNKYLMVSLFWLSLLGCYTTHPLIGDWTVKEKEMSIQDEFKYLLELDSLIITNKFNRQFPSQLDASDQISISKELIQHKDKEFFYQFSDSTLSISHTDVVYPLKYRLAGNKLTIYREFYQGVIRWELERIGEE
jgi:hypothetical protein